MSNDPTSLDNLHDILVPEPLPWWPPAPGWWWVMGFAALALAYALFRAFLRWQHNRYRREALALLSALEAPLRDPAARASATLDLSELLKRTALTAYPRERVASLSGSAWSAFLDRHCPDAAFSNGPGNLLATAVHDPRSVDSIGTPEIDTLVAESRRWIRHHLAGDAAPHDPC